MALASLSSVASVLLRDSIQQALGLGIGQQVGEIIRLAVFCQFDQAISIAAIAGESDYFFRFAAHGICLGSSCLDAFMAKQLGDRFRRSCADPKSAPAVSLLLYDAWCVNFLVQFQSQLEAGYSCLPDRLPCSSSR